MAHHDNHVSTEVPAEMLERHRHGWNVFTAATTKTCVAVAVLLILMLVFLRLL